MCSNTIHYKIDPIATSHSVNMGGWGSAHLLAQTTVAG